VKLLQIAQLLHAEIDVPEHARGDEQTEIRRVAKIEDAGDGDITFLANPKYAKHLPSTQATAVIVGRAVTFPRDTPPAPRPVLLHVDDPYVSFLKLLLVYNPQQPPVPAGIHPMAVIHPSALIGADVRIGAWAVIGEGCTVGEGSMIGHGAVLGDRVSVGARTLLSHSVTVCEGCRIGDRVIIQPGAVIGSDGFGFAPKADGTFEKIPQLGIVVIEDDVEIGANCTIDRATLGETRVRRGAKLDNLIQIAHNVVVGQDTVIAAQTGVAGSTKIGAGCMIGGQVGFVGHIEIADRTKIGAQSGIHKSITKPGETYFGYPAVPYREAFRMYGALPQLSELVATVRELKQKIALLEEEVRRQAT
jgi:UDP-3-O-[3-hydroxymyristoyl] glucosamine N-acyltransferase